MKLRVFLLCAMVTAGMAADLPFAGKWKVNLAKSDFGQTTLTIQELSGGEWQATSFGVSYKFKMDGNEYPDNMGGTVAWKTAGANQWEVVGKANGKITGTDTYTLSADGKTLTDAGKQMKPDGGSMEGTTVYQRASGGPSLAGKWKTRKVSGTAGTIEISGSEDNGLAFKDLDMGMTCDAKLDSKDYPCSGPMLPAGFTVAMKTAGRALDLIVKKDSKPFFKATYTASPDGKTLTETGASTAGGDKFKIVLDRM